MSLESRIFVLKDVRFFDSVKEISASYLENVKLESLDRVESCYLSAYIYENKEKRSSLINVNSNEDKKLPNDTKLEIL